MRKHGYVVLGSENMRFLVKSRPAPPSSDSIPALSGYPLDSSDDSSDEDLSETAKSLHTQTASTSVVHSPPTRPYLLTLPLPVDRERKY
ncbi:hypothetical protein Tco_1030109 [Tanacetum coccineum]|uniref:Uncharacterized protein n=1 Tax=Tanacetum coccineum TaxID=301880 RepID=A0ABQ5G6V4_9ASTR